MKTQLVVTEWANKKSYFDGILGNFDNTSASVSLKQFSKTFLNKGSCKNQWNGLYRQLETRVKQSILQCNNAVTSARKISI